MITRLEERSAAQTARKIEKEFDNVGKTVGQTVGRDLEKGLSEAGAKAGKAAGQSAAKAIAQDKKSFDAAGAAIGDAVSQSLDRSIRGVNLKGFSGFGKAAGTDFSKGFESSLRSLNDRAVDAAASRVISKLSAAGKTSGAAFRTALEAEAKSTSLSMSAIESAAVRQLTSAGRAGGRGFGSAFGSELVTSLPVTGRFASALSGYESVAGKAGAAAGRALGMAFTTAAAGVIGVAGYTLFKGFERYKTIDAAKNRLENLNRVLEQTGKATIDVGRVMDTVNEVVTDTRFSLSDAFAVSTLALSSPTGDLKRFMTVVADTAQFTGQSISEVGEAFLNVANAGKVGLEDLNNQLRGIPKSWLAEHLGVDLPTLNKMLSENQVGLEDLMATMEKNVSGFAKGGVNTIEGAIEQMHTAVARLGANVLGALFGQPTDDANDLAGAINKISERLNDVNSWVTANKDTIKRYFDQAVDAVETLFKALGWVMDRLDDIPGGVNTVVGAFMAWKTISGVTALTESLTKINTMLETTIPASASSAAGKITRALGPVAALLAALEAADWRERLFDFDSDRNVKNRYTRLMEEGKWGELLAGDLWTKVLRPGIMGPEGGPEFPAAPGAPGTPVAPGAGPGAAVAPPGGLAPGTNPLDIFAPTAPQGPDADPGAPAGAPILPPSGTSDDSSSGGGGSGPTLPDAPVLPLDTTIPGRIPGMPVTTSILSAEKSYIDARHDLAQKEARVRQLEASGVATAEDIQKAKNDLLKAEMDFQQAEMRLNEARQSEYEQMAKAADTQSKRLKSLAGDLGEIGAKLDDDFGISKGLAGIAENLTKFLANLAAAPLLGQLGAVAASSPSQGGYGLMGVLGAQGVFGPQFMGLDYDDFDETPAAAGSPSAMGPAELQPPRIGAPTAADAIIALAQASSGGKYQLGASDLAQGLSDCSGAISDLVELLVKGRADSGRLFTTHNAGQVLQSLGAKPGFVPGNLNIGIKHGGPAGGHMSATLPNMVPFESGGGTGQGATYGGKAVGADHPQYTERWTLPVGRPTISPVSGNLGSSTTTSTTSTPGSLGTNIPIPLPVTIVGGMPIITGGFAPSTTPSDTGAPMHAAPGTAPVGTPASGQGLGPLPGPGGPAAGPTTIGGVEPASAPGGGGVGIEGGIAGAGMDAAVTAGSLALDAMAPGAGQAAGQVAQTGMKLMNRTIEFGAQAAGIGVQGLMETFLPNAGSELANNNWLTRVVGGIASAAPALPNVAGKSSQPEPALDGSQLDPNTPIHGTAGGRAPGPISIEYHNHQATEDAAGRDLTFHLSSMHSAPGM